MDSAFRDAIRGLSALKEEPIECKAEEGCRPLAFAPERFKAISPAKGRILFLDGGSQEILATPAFTICSVRVAWALFDGKKKVAHEKKDYQLLMAEEPRLFPPEAAFPKDFSLDECRRRLELQAAIASVTLLRQGDVLCLDGSLVPKAEKRLMAELAGSCQDRGIALLGFCKSSGLLTANGNPFGFALDAKAPARAWQYFPCQDFPLGQSIVGTGFAKFHPKAKPFRFDTSSPECISLIASHCNDPAFLGYPYGLVDADRHARISFKEAEQQRLLLRLRLPELRALAKDAHQGLDSLNKPR
ncbi:MAG: DNA double-strand break repair nuclease NurA [Nanoarchaeota archaeon]